MIRRISHVALTMATLAAALSAAPAMAQAEQALMPWPRAVALQEGALPVTIPFTISFEGFHDAMVDDAAARFQADATRLTGQAPVKAGTPLTIAVGNADPDALTEHARESYKLIVAADGIRLTADGPVGVLRGLATLRQAIQRRDDGFALSMATVDDSPRFAWRGLMIDTVRHFVDFPTLLRQIDMMERVKLNVLHLHLSDNEGFRVESRRFPRLTQRAGKQYYTQAEIRTLVAYAGQRGIRVVPEFDIPAHTGAILAAYPELAASKVDPDNRLSLFTVAMDPTNEETYGFIEKLFGEMAPLFPDAYFHVGGDEVSPLAWSSNPAIADYMTRHDLKDHAALQDAFFGRVQKIIRRLGKIPMGWEEVAHQEIEDDVVVQAWRSSEAVSHIAAQRNRVVVSAGYYLDLLWPGMRHYAIDPQDPLATPPNLPTERLGPAPTGPLDAAQAALVIGGEAPLWAEVVSDEMIDGRLWPRAALVAERFWSPANVRDPESAGRRVAIVQEQLRMQGLQDAANRQRMAARLAPEDAQAVETLAEVTAPVRNMGRLSSIFIALRTGKPIRFPELNSVADTATPDSVEIYRLSSLASAYVRGERDSASSLVPALKRYRDNHDRFVRAAQGRPSLEVAIPVSGDVAALATLGLEAIEMREKGRRPDAKWLASAKILFDRQHAAEAASASIPTVTGGAEQPPANLLILLTPIVEQLAEGLVP